MNKEQIHELRNIIKQHTVKEQQFKAVEECVELADVIIHYQKGDATISDLVDELADVLIMCNQIMIIHQCRDDVEQRIDYKIARQLGRDRDKEMKKSG